MSKPTPGIFNDHANGLAYIALSRAAKVAGIPAYEISAAVSDGTLPVYEVAGCKAVTLADLLKIREGASDER